MCVLTEITPCSWGRSMGQLTKESTNSLQIFSTEHFLCIMIELIQALLLPLPIHSVHISYIRESQKRYSKVPIGAVENQLERPS